MWNELKRRVVNIPGLIALVGVIIVINLGLAWYWSQEPNLFSVRMLVAQGTLSAKAGATASNATASSTTANERESNTIGVATTLTLIRTAEILLQKPGGYLSNDIAPPSLFLDNIPNWEFGVIVQIRDLTRALRKDMSRSQSQSREDLDLAQAEPLFNFNHTSWFLPKTEGEYGKAIELIGQYQQRLVASDAKLPAQFFARADNLQNWLADVGTRLGSLSQRLSASVGQVRVNIDLAGDPAAVQSNPHAAQTVVRTPWFEIDDVFYEARGACWVLIHFLKAIEIDFKNVLVKKNALISMRQIIRELEGTQQALWSPMVLNGGGFGFLSNHSLVMASYISRANAALIDLRDLLTRG